MATYTDRIRQGLPRVPGGEAWPAVGTVPFEAASTASHVEPAEAAVSVVAAAVIESPEVVAPAVAVAVAVAPTSAVTEAPTTAVDPVSAGAVSLGSAPLRRGLPRVAGGEPWPLVRAVQADPTPAEALPFKAAQAETVRTGVVVLTQEPKTVTSVVSVAPSVAITSGDFDEVELRRGLPRTTGGDPWPPAGTARVLKPASTAVAAEPEPAITAATVVAAPTAEPAKTASEEPAADVLSSAEPVAASAPVQTVLAAETVLPASPALTKSVPKPAREPRMIGSRSLAQWVRLGIFGLLGLVAAAGVIVLAARGVTTLPGVPEFLERYPGEYALPAFVADGFPAWARWTHFLNFFFMVLIVQSGMRVRQQQKPPAFYTPKRGGKKVSIHLWLHTSLDVLWLVNGIVFVVLLFVSGHWARVVPTSWEVFPNALSAGLQYLTLEWPHEDGWVNYNSLQQLMYFTVVFIAAPLAALSGARMSEWWPKNAETLNKIYPSPVARAIHFPTMLFFVLFVIVHVFLVFSTGALKNLNHMFNGSPEVSWVGFWWFAAGLVTAALAAIATRPLVLAPIAGVSGKVSQR